MRNEIGSEEWKKSTLPPYWEYKMSRRVRKWWPNGEHAKLNLACGTDYRPDWWNVDLYAPKVDQRIDLFTFPWPIEKRFDFILMAHYIEHIPPLIPGVVGDPLVATVNECARLLKPGGRLLVRTPHREYGMGVIDHYRFLDETTFDFLDPKDPVHSIGPARHMYGIHNMVKRDAFISERGVRITKWFNTVYHFPKYLHWKPAKFGFPREVCFVLEKTG